MIFYYADSCVGADIFVQNLSFFLEARVSLVLSKDTLQGCVSDLLIINGRNLHHQKLKKIIRDYAGNLVVLISDKKFKEQGVLATVPSTSSVRDVADICRLALQKKILEKQTGLNVTEDLLLSALCQGRSNKEIAREHDLALSLVKYHLRNLYEKLGVENRTQAALKADKIIL